ncbi:hypothetical protein CDV55_104884 [Aspergillus turcosus]|uniref:Fe2OG dioxygenase domain-containing protein n=1 Tax=Aspergillus turcosus TaxID=1245748 RepID=A0A229XEJ2_9EURO|nr:hypothetical protein CDV55_104884 [Aspergillus turcosus]RLL97459.1 hypothetical protein CFD26_103664 [Aspergillus turcosus]
MAEIPVLDAKKWVSGDDQERLDFARGLRHGLETLGFIKLINHGFSEEDLKGIFHWNKRFFELPLEQKACIANVPGPKPQRGWSGLGVEKTATLNTPGNRSHANLEDAKEHFDCGPSTDVQFPNVWPEDMDCRFRHFVEAYFEKGQQISLGLMEALEIGFELPRGTFTDRCNGDASELRLNHYPAISAAKLKDGTTHRIWPHTDFGIITLLVQDMVGGLEIWDNVSQTDFLPVIPSSPFELVVNAGDTLQRWCNNVIKAGLHRVATPQLECDIVPERFSVAFFLKAAREQPVGSIEHFVSAEEKPLYENITALEFQALRTGNVY